MFKGFIPVDGTGYTWKEDIFFLKFLCNVCMFIVNCDTENEKSCQWLTLLQNVILVIVVSMTAHVCEYAALCKNMRINVFSNFSSFLKPYMDKCTIYIKDENVTTG